MKLTIITLIRSSKNQKFCFSKTNWSMRKLERIMIAIFTNMFAISSEPSKIFGSSSNVAMRFQDISCLVFSMLMSLYVSEKKAICEPETINETISKKRMIIARMEVACGLIYRSSSLRRSTKKILIKFSKAIGFR